MDDEQFVSTEFFISTTKLLLTLIHELTISMQVQRVAMMRASGKDLPLQPEYLKGLDLEIRKIPDLSLVREAILSMTTTAEINDILRKLEGLQ
jgi:hypothetical protein